MKGVFMENDLMDFARWVADMIFTEEEMDFDLFSELACRRLWKLGIVGKDDENWIYHTEEDNNTNDGKNDNV